MLIKDAEEMLMVWSADVLEIWIEIYAMVIAQLPNPQACKSTVSKMSDSN